MAELSTTQLTQVAEAELSTTQLTRVAEAELYSADPGREKGTVMSEYFRVEKPVS